MSDEIEHIAPPYLRPMRILPMAPAPVKGGKGGPETARKKGLQFPGPSDIISIAVLNTTPREVWQLAKCDFCEKGVSYGIKVSHSHRRSNRMWKPNVKRVKAIVDGRPVHVYACTRCLRSGKVTRAV